MVNYNPAKFDGHRHCVCVYLMLLVVKGQDSTCPRLIPLLLFISKVHGMP